MSVYSALSGRLLASHDSGEKPAHSYLNFDAGQHSHLSHDRYHTEAAREHCAGLIRHENCCITRNERLFSAYEVAAQTRQITTR
jgi:hypothetical protein